MAATVGFGIAASASTASRQTCERRRRFVAAERAQLGHVVAGGEDLVTAEHDDGADVVAPPEIGCGADELAVHLTGQRVGRRPRQQQRGDAGLLVAGVDGDELVHACGVSRL